MLNPSLIFYFEQLGAIEGLNKINIVFCLRQSVAKFPLKFNEKNSFASRKYIDFMHINILQNHDFKKSFSDFTKRTNLLVKTYFTKYKKWKILRKIWEIFMNLFGLLLEELRKLAILNWYVKKSKLRCKCLLSFFVYIW